MGFTKSGPTGLAIVVGQELPTSRNFPPHRPFPGFCPSSASIGRAGLFSPSPATRGWRLRIVRRVQGIADGVLGLSTAQITNNGYAEQHREAKRGLLSRFTTGDGTQGRGQGLRGLASDGRVAGVSLAIAIRDLSLSVKSERGDVSVLKECSLSIPEGQFWMLLGPNGCGKSTLLKAMAGLLRPNGGHMYVIGPRSFVFQNPDHQVVMPSAEADVAFSSGRFDLPPEEVRKRVHEALEAVGMAEYSQRSVQTLSGGQKQRIAVAGALADSSRLLLLDELTTYLDTADQIGVLEAVQKVVRGPQAVTALWVTHRLEELKYADGAVYMENGRVVVCGSVEDVQKHIQMKQVLQKAKQSLQFWTGSP